MLVGYKQVENRLVGYTSTKVVNKKVGNTSKRVDYS